MDPGFLVSGAHWVLRFYVRNSGFVAECRHHDEVQLEF